MEWLFGIGIFLVMLSTLKSLGNLGNGDFWKSVRENPRLASEFFRTQTEWYIGAKPEGLEVMGPFSFHDPVSNKLVNLYCESNKIQNSQERFLSMVQ